MPVILDTSFLVDLLEQRKGAVQLWRRLIAEGQQFLLPTPVVTEYLAGSRNPESDLVQLRASGEFVPFGEAESLAAAAFARRAFREGRFPGWLDLLIAGIAKERGDLPIATGNPDHFPFSKTVSY